MIKYLHQKNKEENNLEMIRENNHLQNIKTNSN